MTFHLVGPYMTTTNYKKRKKKNLTDNQRLKLEQEWRAYNKRMRQQNCHSAQFEQFEQYLSYIRGEHKPRKQEFETYKPKPTVHRETKQYPSLSNTIDGFAPRKESQQYTGDLIVGIGTMHKSNAVPIMRGTNEAKDLARMRR